MMAGWSDAFLGPQLDSWSQLATRGDSTRQQWYSLTAIDMNVGNIATLVWRGCACNRHTFELFVAMLVLPRTAASARVFMYDNASWHSEPGMVQLLAAAAASGHPQHRFVQRPVHSPDFAPSEWAHASAEVTLKRHAAEVTAANFGEWLQAAYDSVDQRLGRAFYANAYYIAPGHARTRYHGQQATGT